MSYLRDPRLDPDEVLDPGTLIELELAAEGSRAGVAELTESQQSLIRCWISDELEVARRRAEAVNDHDFVECLRMIERRLLEPGSFMSDARAWAKVRKVLAGKPSLSLVQGGKRSA